VLKQEQEKQVHLPPIIHHYTELLVLQRKQNKFIALVTPTRELAVQIGQSFDTYAKYTNLTQHTILVEYHKTSRYFKKILTF
jgi:superfamily II DNA/RNA helicase